MSNYRFSFFLLISFLLNGQSSDRFTLHYNQPASQWYEALPIGNGRLGAMVFGAFDQERVQLNEESLWAGHQFDNNNPTSLKNLKKIRQALFDGELVSAEAMAEKHMLGKPERVRSYQTLGDLNIDYSYKSKLSYYNRRYPNAYKRELNLHNGVATSEFKIRRTTVIQRVFSSAVDDVIVVKINFSNPSAVSFKLSRGINLPSSEDQIEPFNPSNYLNVDRWSKYNDSTFKIDYFHQENGVHYSGQVIDIANEKEGPGGEHMRYAAILRVHTTDGNVQTVSNDYGAKINITDATEVVLVFNGETDYNIEKLNFDHSIDPLEVAQQKITKVSQKDYWQIFRAHDQDHRSLFERVDIKIGKDEFRDLATDQRLALIQNKDSKDPGLIGLYYQFGRYLLMGSSRSPGKLPANLQGIWNDLFKAPWNSDFHANINLQMNYWPAEITHLHETLSPLANFMKQLTVPGAATAKKMYGANGWTMHHLTDPFGKTGVMDGIHGITPLNGAWMTFPLFRHYEYTQDLDYLREDAYPTIKGAVEFVLDYLVRSPEGYLVSSPSVSPENHYFDPNTRQKVELSYAPTVDKQIIEMLFDIFIKSANLLRQDKKMVAKVKSVYKKLPPYRLTKYGTIQEWIKDFEEFEPGHRHISHLLGVYPFGTINPNQPKLFEAAKKTVVRRLANGGGHTGWSRAWIIGLYARFFDAEKAVENLYALLKKSTLKNLFDNHPPFQIDGNFGGTAAINEMLIQSNNNQIHLLPALPNEWPEGYLKGVRVKGACTVGFNWKFGRPENFKITSDKGGYFIVKFMDKKIPVHLTSGQTIELEGKVFY